MGGVGPFNALSFTRWLYYSNNAGSSGGRALR